jgi:hypothetical protein
MTQDIAFLERADYMQNGVMKYEVFCPLTEGAKKKKSGKAASKKATTGEEGDGDEPPEPPAPKQVSALQYQYCPELHKMVGYMRRLDGAYPNTSRGHKVMDPLAPDGQPKWATNGSKLTPLFGWWAYYAWEKVFYPVLVKVMGSIVLINDEEDVDALCEAEVMV